MVRLRSTDEEGGTPTLLFTQGLLANTLACATLMHSILFSVPNPGSAAYQML